MNPYKVAKHSPKWWVPKLAHAMLGTQPFGIMYQGNFSLKNFNEEHTANVVCSALNIAYRNGYQAGGQEIK